MKSRATGGRTPPRGVIPGWVSTGPRSRHPLPCLRPRAGRASRLRQSNRWRPATQSYVRSAPRLELAESMADGQMILIQVRISLLSATLALRNAPYVKAPLRRTTGLVRPVRLLAQ
jgi:hypothetical protein